jgi:lipid II:glycine glycyltransferase (peptidoglycan interpeptide bridge formation enzyme)
MKPKGRYNIKVAEKSNVTTEWKSCMKENIEIFYKLLTETTKRDGFATNSLEYFMNLGEYIEKNNLSGLLFASRENEILAAGLFIYYGKTALYYYGASVSTAEKRKYMASYALQWEAICEARRRGCTKYDFLGIAPPKEANHHLA